MPKKVLLVVAHKGFQPVEYGMPKKVLTAAGITVVTASDQGGQAASAISGERAAVDITLDQAQVSDYDGVFFVGGPGALEHLDNHESYRIIRTAAASGKPWGAICISPRILAHAGVLKNKTATGWDGDGKLGSILETVGATYVPEPVVTDGTLITAQGPVAATEFGKAIAAALQ